MIKIEKISHIPNVKTALNNAAESVVAKFDTPEVHQLSFESISAIQKALIALKHKSLDVNTKASKFFGVDSAQNILCQIGNQVNLTVNKCLDNNIIPGFPKKCTFSIDKESSLGDAWKCLWDGTSGQFKKLHFNPARLTFGGKFFGNNGEEGLHTIGLIFLPKTKTLLCLDSLCNKVKEIKDYQKILSERLFNSPEGEIKKIIFSNKPQQGINDYTCNNWTLANIESVQKALKKGINIDNEQTLNSLLRDDINIILKEQYEYLIKKQ